MESPKRKNNRLPNYDYGSEGCYFVTICIKDRRPIVSDFVGVDVLGDPQRIKLLPYGIIADKYINQINEFYVNINVDKYVIMPDHMHILLSVTDNGAPRTSPLRDKQQRYRISFRPSKDFVIRRSAKMFGNGDITTTLSETGRIMTKFGNT